MPHALSLVVYASLDSDVGLPHRKYATVGKVCACLRHLSTEVSSIPRLSISVWGRTSISASSFCARTVRGMAEKPVFCNVHSMAGQCRTAPRAFNALGPLPSCSLLRPASTSRKTQTFVRPMRLGAHLDPDPGLVKLQLLLGPSCAKQLFSEPRWERGGH